MPCPSLACRWSLSHGDPPPGHTSELQPLATCRTFGPQQCLGCIRDCCFSTLPFFYCLPVRDQKVRLPKHHLSSAWPASQQAGLIRKTLPYNSKALSHSTQRNDIIELTMYREEILNQIISKLQPSNQRNDQSDRTSNSSSRVT